MRNRCSTAAMALSPPSRARARSWRPTNSGNGWWRCARRPTLTYYNSSARVAPWPRSPPGPACTRAASAASSTIWPSAWPRAPTREGLSMPPADVSTVVAAQLAEELAARWRHGERPGAEEFLARQPELGDRPEAALALIYEELCQRKEHGESPEAAVAAVQARFPQWQAQIEALLACHRLLEPDRDELPAVGDIVGEFRLLAELGSGAMG